MQRWTSCVLTNLSVINCYLFIFIFLRYWHGKREGYQSSLLQNGKLTAATLLSLTGILCHEDCKVRGRHFRQVLVESCTCGLGRAWVSLFCVPFSSFLFSLLLRYCFLLPAMASRSPKQNWRLMPKIPSLPQKTPFRFIHYQEYHETSETSSFVQLYKWVDMRIILTNHINDYQGAAPAGQLKWTHITLHHPRHSSENMLSLCFNFTGVKNAVTMA